MNILPTLVLKKLHIRRVDTNRAGSKKMIKEAWKVFIPDGFIKFKYTS